MASIAPTRILANPATTLFFLLFFLFFLRGRFLFLPPFRSVELIAQFHAVPGRSPSHGASLHKRKSKGSNPVINYTAGGCVARPVGQAFQPDATRKGTCQPRKAD